MFRKLHGWSVIDLAVLSETSADEILALETPGYDWNAQTVLNVATAFDLALMVQFVSTDFTGFIPLQNEWTLKQQFVRWFKNRTLKQRAGFVKGRLSPFINSQIKMKTAESAINDFDSKSRKLIKNYKFNKWTRKALEHIADLFGCRVIADFADYATFVRTYGTLADINSYLWRRKHS